MTHIYVAGWASMMHVQAEVNDPDIGANDLEAMEKLASPVVHDHEYWLTLDINKVQGFLDKVRTEYTDRFGEDEFGGWVLAGSNLWHMIDKNEDVIAVAKITKLEVTL